VRLRWVVGVLAVLALLAGAVVVTSSVLHNLAEQRVADELTTGLGLDRAPDVQIDASRPFLLQLMRGRLDELTASTPELTLDALTVVDVHLVAHDVTTTTPTRAATVEVVGVVPTETVQRSVAEQSGLDVTVAVTNGALRASGSVLGLELGLSLAPRVESGRLLMDVVAVDLAGAQVAVDQLPDQLRQQLTGYELPVTGLPAGLAVADARVVASGVELTVSGTDVVLPGAGG